MAWPVFVRCSRAAGTHRVIVAAVELDGGRGRVGESHSEGVGIGAELLHEAVLHAGQLGLVVGRIDLLGGQLHLLAEVQAHDLILLATETVRDRDLRGGGGVQWIRGEGQGDHAQSDLVARERCLILFNNESYCLHCFRKYCFNK